MDTPTHFCFCLGSRERILKVAQSSKRQSNDRTTEEKLLEEIQKERRQEERKKNLSFHFICQSVAMETKRTAVAWFIIVGVVMTTILVTANPVVNRSPPTDARGEAIGIPEPTKDVLLQQLNEPSLDLAPIDDSLPYLWDRPYDVVEGQRMALKEVKAHAEPVEPDDSVRRDDHEYADYINYWHPRHEYNLNVWMVHEAGEVLGLSERDEAKLRDAMYQILEDRHASGRGLGDFLRELNKAIGVLFFSSSDDTTSTSSSLWPSSSLKSMDESTEKQENWETDEPKERAEDDGAAANPTKSASLLPMQPVPQ